MNTAEPVYNDEIPAKTENPPPTQNRKEVRRLAKLKKNHERKRRQPK